MLQLTKLTMIKRCEREDVSTRRGDRAFKLLTNKATALKTIYEYAPDSFHVTTVYKSNPDWILWKKKNIPLSECGVGPGLDGDFKKDLSDHAAVWATFVV